MSMSMGKMSWSKVSKKEIKHSIRSKSLWAVTALFVLFAAGSTLGVGLLSESIRDSRFGEGFESIDVTSDFVIGFLAGTQVSWLTTAFIALIALFFTYSAVVGERESGSIRILLGLPHSRGNVFLGKFAGRSLVIGASIVIGFALAGLVILVAPYFDQFLVINFVQFVFLSFVLSIVFVSIAMLFSTVSKSKTNASAGAIAVFFVFQFLWEPFRRVLLFLVQGDFATGFRENPPAWFHGINRFNPNVAYSYLSKTFLTSDSQSNTLLSQGQGVFSVNPNARMSEMYGDLPIYLKEEFAVFALLFWVFVPAVLAYFMFRRADIE